MREILFRGKRVDNGEWVYGYIYYGFDIEYISQGFDDVPERCYHISDLNGNLKKVISETIGQYTGLKDKNGVKLFEGDIISVYGGAKYIVKFIQFEWGASNGNVYYGFCQLKTEITEVIGNVHDD